MKERKNFPLILERWVSLPLWTTASMHQCIYGRNLFLKVVWPDHPNKTRIEAKTSGVRDSPPYEIWGPSPYRSEAANGYKIPWTMWYFGRSSWRRLRTQYWLEIISETSAACWYDLTEKYVSLHSVFLSSAATNSSSLSCCKSTACGFVFICPWKEKRKIP